MLGTQQQASRSGPADRELATNDPAGPASGVVKCCAREAWSFGIALVGSASNLEMVSLLETFLELPFRNCLQI